MRRAWRSLRHSLRWLAFRARFGRYFRHVPYSTEIGRGVCVSGAARDPAIELGPGVRLEDGVWLEVGPKGRISLGARTWLSRGCVVSANSSVEIGEECLIGEYTSIRDADHVFERRDVPIRDQGVTSQPIVLGRGVWIGRGVAVLRGVAIGDGAVVGANAVVTRAVPPFCVALGVPARVRGGRPKA